VQILEYFRFNNDVQFSKTVEYNALIYVLRKVFIALIYTFHCTEKGKILHDYISQTYKK